MTDKNLPENTKKRSIADEFNRQKRITKKMHINTIDKEFGWKCFLAFFRKTFKVKKDGELHKDFKWNAKIANISSNYEIDIFDEQKKILQITWSNHEDKYWMKFRLYKRLLSSKYAIKVTEYIIRDKAFWGLQDTVGLIWLKSNFKREVKRMKASINLVIENNGEVPDSFDDFVSDKYVLRKIKLKNINNNEFELKKMLKDFYQTKFNFDKLETFTSKKNKYSIVYKMKKIDNNEIIIEWNQDKDHYEIEFKIIDNKLLIKQKITSLWTFDSKRKLKLIKSNFNNYVVNDIKKLI